MPQWLTDEQQRAWRGLVQMTSRLDARLNRDLQRTSGLSLADYDVLVLLTEAPEGRRRVFELGESLQWEQSRLRSHPAAFARSVTRARLPGASVSRTSTSKSCRDSPESACSCRCSAAGNRVSSDTQARQIRCCRSSSHGLSSVMAAAYSGNS